MSDSGAGRVAEAWRRLHGEQRLAGVAAALVIVSTFGPFSFIEAAEVVTAASVLALLKLRADRREFHLPLGDGTVIAGAGAWCALLMATRLFERPVGQSALALSCALLLCVAGLRERVKRPADDLPEPLEAFVSSVSPRRSDAARESGSDEEPVPDGETERDERPANDRSTARPDRGREAGGKNLPPPERPSSGEV